ncbi:MAG: hypothetical protein ACPKQO_00365 [Nitrososphaeraceae archaeon]
MSIQKQIDYPISTEAEFLKGDFISDYLEGTGFSIIDKFLYLDEKGPRPIGATDPCFSTTVCGHFN